jgi:hypothetical protein
MYPTTEEAVCWLTPSSSCVLMSMLTGQRLEISVIIEILSNYEINKMPTSVPL